MIKIRNKRIALLLVLMMLATMFVGVGTASAATTNIALTVPSVPATANGVTLGTMRLSETEATVGSINAGQQITINLPSGVSYAAAPTAATLGNYVAVDGVQLIGVDPAAGADITFVAGTTKSLTVLVAGRTLSTDKAYIEFLFTGGSAVNLDGAAADIAVEVYAPNSGVSSGSVVVATTSSAGTTTTVMTSATVANGANKAVGTIRIAETRANAVKTTAGGNGTIKVIAPDGVDFDGATANTYVNWIQGAVPATSTNADGYREYSFTVVPTAAGANPGFVNIAIVADITDRDLTGPIEFTIKGDNVTTQKVTVGTIGDYDIAVEAESSTPPTVKAGFAAQDLDDFTIKESLAGSFVNNRDFVITLPSYAHWQVDPTVTVDKGNGAFAKDQAATVTMDSQRNKISFTYTASATPTKTAFTFEDMRVFVDANAPEGDLIATVDGRAIGGSFDLVLGTVVKPVTATASPTEVKIGLFDQAASDITITEAGAGMLKAQVTEIATGWGKTAITGFISNNNAAGLVVSLPAGVTFASTPVVAVTEGDLKLDASGIEVNANNTALTIPISKTSTVASEIVISGITYTLNRTVPEGDVTVSIAGNAVDQTANNLGQFDTAVAKVANAVTVTPAPGEVQTVTELVIGASTITVNGVEVNSFAPSYIKDSRTYLAIRDIATALGIDQNNVMWDGTKNTVTLMKGDKVVQMTIGSKTLLINGAAVTMDVAPEVGPADRTMLPAAFVAQAFGATASWDAATQTVTIK